MKGFVSAYSKRVFSVTIATLFLASSTFPSNAFSFNKSEKDNKLSKENKSISVTITTPDGVPASVELVGKSTFYASKEPSGTEAIIMLDLPFGAYHVDAKPVTFNGRYYTATTSQPEMPVGLGKDKDGNLRVEYTLADSAQDFHVTKVEATSISLAWTAPKYYKIKIDRIEELEPAYTKKKDVKIKHIKIDGNTAIDSDLQPGTEYAYSLFTQHNGKWVGPMVLHVKTTNTADTSQATYVVAQNTLLLDDTDIVSAEPTGNGVHVILNNTSGTPLIGSAVVLPISPSLPGGFLGIVTGVSTNGHELDLVAGGLSDAFDYYNINIPDISAGSVDSEDIQSASTAATISVNQQDRSIHSTAMKPLVATTLSPQAATSSLLPSSLQDCLGGSLSQDISFDPSFVFAGHFNLVIDKYNILGLDIPKGASLDAAIKATISGAASIKTTQELTCGLDLKPILVNIVPAPVPISLDFFPSAEVTIDGTQEVSNLGFAVTGGFQMSGYIGIPDGGTFTADPILTAVPLTPNVTTNETFGLKVGGQLIFGPGVGTTEAGVIAGLSGELDLIDVNVDPSYMDKTCMETKAGSTFDVSVTAKGWLGSFSTSKSFHVLDETLAWPFTPWYFPDGCQNDEPKPDKDLLGSGVTKVDEGTVDGSIDQWTHTDNLSPGHAAWILSTGNAADIIGVPSQEASTDLGEPGDDTLSTLSGKPTYDAASYTVTLVPTGSMLHVKYVFASEEYPEWVDSAYNDVMAVFVNGVNCATISETNIPVSINTINDHTNASYYIDNSTSASGYNTSMDGLTVPLTCSVPVTPGVPVTVKIAVADASDHVLDSAVALLDQGIWSSN